MVRSNKKFFWFILSVLLVLIAIGLVLAREASESQKLASKLSQLRARGFVLDNASLAKQYEANTTIDAAQAWEVVFEQLQGFYADYDGLLDGKVDEAGIALLRVFEADPSGVEPVKAFLRKYAKPYRQTIDCSSQTDSPRFIKKMDGPQTLLPHCSHIRSAARLVKLHGLMAIHERNSNDVLTDILTLIQSADALSSGPTLIEQLVACSFQTSAHHLIKASIEQSVLSPTEMQRLLPVLVDHSEIGSGWHRALSGELAAVLPVFSNSEARNFAMSGSTDAWLAYLPLRSADANLYIELLEQALAIPTNDLGKMKVEISKLSLRQVSLKQANLLHRIDSALTSELAPDMSKVGERFIETAVQSRLCAVGVAIRMYESKMGRRPVDLESLRDVGIDCSALKPADAARFGYDPKLAIQLWNPDSASKESYISLSQKELKEYLKNLGLSEWRFQ